jgi:hypothetical protein
VPARATVPVVDGLAETLARGDGVLGDMALRRRVGFDGRAVVELIVNGTFVMDTAQTAVMLDVDNGPSFLVTRGMRPSTGRWPWPTPDGC